MANRRQTELERYFLTGSKVQSRTTARKESKENALQRLQPLPSLYPRMRHAARRNGRNAQDIQGRKDVENKRQSDTRPYRTDQVGVGRLSIPQSPAGNSCDLMSHEISIPTARVLTAADASRRYSYELAKYGVRRESIERTANENWILAQETEAMRKRHEKQWRYLVTSFTNQGVPPDQRLAQVAQKVTRHMQAASVRIIGLILHILYYNHI